MCVTISFLSRLLHDSASCQESWQEAESCRQSRQKVIFCKIVVFEGNERLGTVTTESKYNGQSQQEPKLAD